MMSSSVEADAAHDRGGRKPLFGSATPNSADRPPRDGPMVNVQPPKIEDLQPRYAQTLTGESDTSGNSWYGGMSK
jgi:hypothetical protein